MIGNKGITKSCLTAIEANHYGSPLLWVTVRSHRTLHVCTLGSHTLFDASQWKWQIRDFEFRKVERNTWLITTGYKALIYFMVKFHVKLKVIDNLYYALPGQNLCETWAKLTASKTSQPKLERTGARHSPIVVLYHNLAWDLASMIYEGPETSSQALCRIRNSPVTKRKKEWTNIKLITFQVKN